MKKLLATASFLMVSALFAPAYAVTAGQYSVGGIQQICLVGGPVGFKNWYGTTFSAWGGQWKQNFIFGNYASGAGNDVIHVTGGTTAHWVEWRDDLSFRTVLTGLAFTFVKSSCDPPAAPLGRPVGNPSGK